jgi:hypothetical protein
MMKNSRKQSPKGKMSGVLQVILVLLYYTLGASFYGVGLYGHSGLQQSGFRLYEEGRPIQLRMEMEI